MLPSADIDRMVLDYVRKHAPCTASDIDRGDLPMHRIYDALARLRVRGVISADGRRPNRYSPSSPDTADRPLDRPLDIVPCPTCQGHGRVRRVITYEVV